MALSDGREVMQVKKLSDNAIMPVRGSEYAAGFDLASAYETTVPAGRQALIKTDLSIAIPPNTYARIAPRSGLAVKKMIDVGAGVVDYDYRGPVGVVIFNHGSEDFKVNKGDRVAQLILERISMAGIEEVAELSETTRGSGGFGSTGVTHKALETSAVENGPNKHKTSSPLTKSQESQRNMLQLVDEAIETLDLDPDSDLALKLRKQAMGICWLSFGEKMAAIASRYEETGDKKAMLLNLDCID